MGLLELSLQGADTKMPLMLVTWGEREQSSKKTSHCFSGRIGKGASLYMCTELGNEVETEKNADCTFKFRDPNCTFLIEFWERRREKGSLKVKYKI